MVAAPQSSSATAYQYVVVVRLFSHMAQGQFHNVAQEWEWTEVVTRYAVMGQASFNHISSPLLLTGEVAEALVPWRDIAWSHRRIEASMRG